MLWFRLVQKILSSSIFENKNLLFHFVTKFILVKIFLLHFNDLLRYYIFRPKSKNVFFQFNGNITNALWLQLFPTINNSSLILLETDVMNDESVVSSTYFTFLRRYETGKILKSAGYIFRILTVSSSKASDRRQENLAQSRVVGIYFNRIIIHFHKRTNVRFVYNLVKLSFIINQKKLFHSMFHVADG